MMNAEQRKQFMCDGCTSMHKVAIFKEAGKYRVEPGRLVVHPGAKVVFVSVLRGEPVPYVWFPEGLREKGPLPIEAGKPLRVDVGTEPGVFPYAVYVPGEEGADFAEGGSAGRIIVADP